MSLVMDLPVLGLGTDWPEELFVLHHRASNKYGCYCYEGVYGLAAFSEEVAAVRFAEFVDLDGMSIQEVSFDEAREVAKDRPLPVVSLMLLDTMEAPMIHFVR